MQIRIRPGAKNHTEAFARFHRVACDKPFDDGGGDTGMTPEELMLSALGCSAMQRAAVICAREGCRSMVSSCVFRRNRLSQGWARSPLMSKLQD